MLPPAAFKCHTRYQVVHEQGKITRFFRTNNLSDARAHIAELSSQAPAKTERARLERRAAMTIARHLEPGIEMPLPDGSEVAIVEFDRVRSANGAVESVPRLNPRKKTGTGMTAAQAMALAKQLRRPR